MGDEEEGLGDLHPNFRPDWHLIRAIEKGCLYGVRDAISATDRHDRTSWTVTHMHGEHRRTEHDPHTPPLRKSALYKKRSVLSLWYASILTDKHVNLYDFCGLGRGGPNAQEDLAKYIVGATRLCITTRSLRKLTTHVMIADSCYARRRFDPVPATEEEAKETLEKYCNDVIRAVGCGDHAERSREGVAVFSRYAELYTKHEGLLGPEKHKCREDAAFTGLQDIRREALENQDLPCDCVELILTFVYVCPWKLSTYEHCTYIRENCPPPPPPYDPNVTW